MGIIKNGLKWLALIVVMSASANAEILEIRYLGTITEKIPRVLLPTKIIQVSFYDSQISGKRIVTPIVMRDVPINKSGDFTVAIAMNPDDWHKITSQKVWIEFIDTEIPTVYPREPFSLIPYAMKTAMSRSFRRPNFRIPKPLFTSPNLTSGCVKPSQTLQRDFLWLLNEELMPKNSSEQRSKTFILTPLPQTSPAISDKFNR